jgi:hypothetical protein
MSFGMDNQPAAARLSLAFYHSSPLPLIGTGQTLIPGPPALLKIDTSQFFAKPIPMPR